jgi:hypothetical protein
MFGIHHKGKINYNSHYTINLVMKAS